MNKILVVSAHPDDEILGCGATLAKRILEGDKVFLLILGEGITARYSNRFEADRGELSNLKNSLDNVSKTLGVEKYWQFGYPDNRFDSIDLLDIVKSVELIKKEISPNIIYTHFCNDLNIDHRITFSATLTACRPFGNESVKEMYSFESFSSTEWVYNSKHVFTPNVMVNVENTIEKKLEMLKLYDEIKDYPHPRSIEAIRVSAQKHGISVGCKYAEAFELVRMIK